MFVPTVSLITRLVMSALWVRLENIKYAESSGIQMVYFCYLEKTSLRLQSLQNVAKTRSMTLLV